MTARWRRNTTRLGSVAVALLAAVGGCQSTAHQTSDAPVPATQASTAPAHKPLIALPTWLGGSAPTTASTSSAKATAVPTPPPPAMPMPDAPAAQPVITTTTFPTTATTAVATTMSATMPATMATTMSATTTFVEQPTSAGIALTTMPTTVPAVTAPSPTTAVSVAPLTVPNPATRPVASAGVAVASTPPAPPPAAAAAVDPNAGVVAHKPFIAVSRWFGRTPPEGGGGGQPSILLLQHARSDSPVPLSDYAKQPTHALSAFELRASLSAAELSRRLGPPAQLADYASPWYVYRLSSGRELWLHFAQPDEQTLLAADVIGVAEDGYTRNRVFSILGMP